MGLLTILKKIKQKEKEIRILILGLDNAGKTTILKRFCGQPIDTIEPTLGFNIQTLDYHQRAGRGGGGGLISNNSSSNNNINDDDDRSKHQQRQQQQQHQLSLSPFSYRLNFWDVGGQKSIRAYWRNYFEETDGLIYVVDSVDRIRLETCKNELLNLLRQERLAGATVLVFANKQDMNGSMSISEIAQALGLPSSDDVVQPTTSTTTSTTATNNISSEAAAAEQQQQQQETNTNAQYLNRHWCIRPCSAVSGDGLVDGIDWLVDDITGRIYMHS